MAQRDDREKLALAAMQLIDQGHRNISRRLNLVRVQVLAAVAANEPVRPATIAAELDLTASATSRHLTALEQAELITVTPDPEDARTFLVRQTERGRAEMDATIRAGTTVFTEVVAAVIPIIGAIQVLTVVLLWAPRSARTFFADDARKRAIAG